MISKAGYMANKHLIDQGCENCTFSGDQSLKFMKIDLKAIKKHLDHGIKYDETYVIQAKSI
jgi:DNA-binding LacI/PurR family transcriptional regulator